MTDSAPPGVRNLPTDMKHIPDATYVPLATNADLAAVVNEFAACLERHGRLVQGKAEADAAVLREVAVRLSRLDRDEAAIQRVKCDRCARRRGLDDPDYSPAQAMFGQPLGWYSGDDGEFCGECLEAIIRPGTKKPGA